MIRNKCGKLKLGNLVLASHIFPVIKFLLSHSTQLLNSNIQKHENDLGLYSKYRLTSPRYRNTLIVIVNYHVVQENRHMAGVFTH